jgi:hydrogenase small subunit
MPGFPDKFSPFYKAPPGTTVSSHASRFVGSFVRPLRRITQRDRNRQPNWDHGGQVPSGWGAASNPTVVDKAVHFFYEKLRKSDSAAKHIG